MKMLFRLILRRFFFNDPPPPQIYTLSPHNPLPIYTFFVKKGNNKIGNLYVNEAFQNGASLAIANNQKKSKKKIVVDDTLQLLTEASSKLRENLSSKIISITGSCGKTSLKELLGKTLSKISNVTYSPKSFNNKFGVPLSLFNLKKK